MTLELHALACRRDASGTLVCRCAPLILPERAFDSEYNERYRGETGIAYHASAARRTCSPRPVRRVASTEVSP